MENIFTNEEISEIKILEEYEEATGILLDVKSVRGSVVLVFRNFSIAFPSDYEALKTMVGKRIAVLRTDLPDKPYAVREVRS